MKQFKNFFLIALMVLVGGMVSSCGDDDDNGGGGSGVGTYTLKCHISDYGTLPQEYAKYLNDGLEQNINQQYPNVSLDLVKKALDDAVADAIKNGQFGDADYNYTIEFYIVDSKGNKVYSRYITVKDGKAYAS